jgi:hypothetical protein
MGAVIPDLRARLAEFQEAQRLAREGGARMLPVEEIAGRLYYRDNRLREYRNVDNPHDRIPFDERCSREVFRDRRG